MKQQKNRVHPDVKKAMNRKNRQENMTQILNSLNPDNQNFNTILLGFADIIQSTFYHGLRSTECRNEKERKAMHERVNEQVNNVIALLNEESSTHMEDMVVLSTVMVECIYRAMLNQTDNGYTLSSSLVEAD